MKIITIKEWQRAPLSLDDQAGVLARAITPRAAAERLRPVRIEQISVTFYQSRKAWLVELQCVVDITADAPAADEWVSFLGFSLPRFIQAGAA